MNEELAIGHWALNIGKPVRCQGSRRSFAFGVPPWEMTRSKRTQERL
ncbi:MAG: hypothetical protein V7K40_29970 [Nostoc sp.]